MAFKMWTMQAEDYFKALVAIPSPSGNEGEIASYISSVMEGNGYERRSDDAGNLAFFLPSGKARRALCAHMDTVAKASGAVLMEDDEKFFTDGTTALGADDKCALSCLLALADEKKDVVFIITAAEEDGCRGSKMMDRSILDGLSIEALFVLDADGDVGSILVSAPFKSIITITVAGRSAHSAFNPEDGVNAIAVLSKIASRFPQGRTGVGSTANIGSFMAPGSPNVVNDSATMVCEVRSMEAAEAVDIPRRVSDMAEETAAKYGARCSVSVKRTYDGYRLDYDDLELLDAMKAVSAIGRKPRLVQSMGGSDTNNFRRKGIRAITLSCGYRNPHSTEEYIPKKELDALLTLCRELC